MTVPYVAEQAIVRNMTLSEIRLTERQTLRGAESLARESMPPSWKLDAQSRIRKAGTQAEWTIVSPDRQRAIFNVSVVMRPEARRINEVLARHSAAGGANPLIVSPYLSPTIRGLIGSA